MAGSVNGRDQSADDPKPNYPVPSTSQFPQPSYPFPIDSELTMTSNYPVPQYARQLDDAARTVDTAGNGPPSTSPLNHTGASPSAAITDPAITMSQPPHQSQPQFTSGTLRASIDDSLERAQVQQSSDKRKRSKTSRACDECRRKKIRCDAPTEADGVPKTCTNCQKAGALCEFERKPMKRGPSRGYIRELSERVQQVELVQKQALRQSIDAGAGLVPYAETALPDPANSGANRTFSFNEPRPFATSEFQRDRIPSSGTWGLHPTTSATATPSLHTRERGSLAIAPDQAFPPSGPPESEDSRIYETVDPGWPGTEGSPTPKRRRIEPPANLQAIKMDPTFLSGYYKQIDPLFPLLPDPETVIEVVAQAPEFSHAFAAAIELFPYIDDEVTVNGNHDNGPSATSSEKPDNHVKRALKSDLFPNYIGLAAYMDEQMKEDPGNRSEDENLACVWTFLLLTLESEADVKTMEKHPMSKSDLLHYSLRTLAHLRSRATRSEDDTIKDSGQFTRIVNQAYNCAGVLTKYHALSIGIGSLDLAPPNDMLVVKQVEGVSLEAAFIAESSLFVAYASSLLPVPMSDGYGADMARYFIRGLIRPGLEQLVERSGNLEKQSPVVRQVIRLVSSLTIRVDRRNLELEIASSSAGMMEALASEAAASAQQPRFNPLDMHVSALLVITLCEVVNSCSSAGLTPLANMYLNEVKELLQKKSQAFHKSYGFEWFYAPGTPGEKEAADQYRINHWTDCLLRMIDWVQTKPPAVEKTHDSSRLVFPDFQLTARNGWLHILSNFQA